MQNVIIKCYYCLFVCSSHWAGQHTMLLLYLFTTVYGRFPDGYFPGWFFSRKDVSRIVIFPDRTFPGKTIPGWSLSRKDVSRVVIFPDETFPRKASWMVALMFNCSWHWSLTEQPCCVYLFKWIYSQFAPLTNSSQVNMRQVGIQCYQVPVVLILRSGRHCHCVASI